jgi:hypothetical protein
MNAMQQIGEIVGFEYFDFVQLAEKARVNQRRKAKFNPNCYTGVKRHWANHAGTYKDEELMKGPKYWHGQKPVRVVNPIKSYQDLATAIGLIASGDRNYSNYKGTCGIDEERLRLAQSWRDRGKDYDVSDVVRLGMREIKTELGFGKVRNGHVYCH